jgi:NUMOD3 motif
MPHPGWRHSDETRARLAAAHLGKRHSAATRQKISDGQRGLRLGQKLSEEQKAKMAASRRGKRFTSEHCDNLSQAHLERYARILPPASAAVLAWREKRRIYKRALRARRREKITGR